MEHQNCCTDLRHPELLAACCPYSSVHGKLVVQHPSRTKNVGKLPPLRSFSFLTLRDAHAGYDYPKPRVCEGRRRLWLRDDLDMAILPPELAGIRDVAEDM